MLRIDIGNINGYSVFYAWIGFDNGKELWRFTLELGFYRLFISLPEITWFKE